MMINSYPGQERVLNKTKQKTLKEHKRKGCMTIEFYYKYKVKVEIGEKLVRPGQKIKILVFRGLQEQTS